MDQAETTPKDVMLRILAQQPAGSSYEELLKELAFALMLERSLADIEAGRTLMHEQMKQKIMAWGCE